MCFKRGVDSFLEKWCGGVCFLGEGGKIENGRAKEFNDWEEKDFMPWVPNVGGVRDVIEEYVDDDDDDDDDKKEGDDEMDHEILGGKYVDDEEVDREILGTNDGDGDEDEGDGHVTFNSAAFRIASILEEHSQQRAVVVSSSPGARVVIPHDYSTPLEERVESIVPKRKSGKRAKPATLPSALAKAKRRLEPDAKENADNVAPSKSLFKQIRDIGLEAKPSSGKRRRPEAPAATATADQSVPQDRSQLYDYARIMLNRQMVVARDKELGQLDEFVSGLLAKKRGGAVYCYGASGVGKSASIASCCAKLQQQRRSLRSLTMNLATASHASNFLAEVLSHVLQREDQLGFFEGLGADTVTRKLRTEFQDHPFILVLEEADQEVHLAAVRDLWTMAVDEHLQLILLATGNKRNFAAVTLQIQGTVELHFEPYTRDDLMTILEGRLTAPVVNGLFEGIALRQICEKVAYNGDLRTAISYVTAAIRVAEEDYLTRLEDGTGGKVDARVVRRVFETLGNGSNASLVEAFATLTPVAQQLLVAMVKGKYGDPTKRQLEHEFSMAEVRKLYCLACRVERPDQATIKVVMEQLTDTPFVSFDEHSNSYRLHIDLQIAQQAVASDAGLQCLSPG